MIALAIGRHKSDAAHASQVCCDGAQRESQGTQVWGGLMFLQVIVVDVHVLNKQAFGIVVPLEHAYLVFVSALDQLSVYDRKVKPWWCFI